MIQFERFSFIYFNPVTILGPTLPVQWSPTEPNVFASCSVDGSIAIWDTRLGKSAAASFKAHNADVNVISWNRCLIVLVYLYLEILTCLIFYVVTSFGTSLILIRLASCMLASGCDDGTFSIRDLRLLKVWYPLSDLSKILYHIF
jgi:ribosome assembly protein RRB1